jgi:hypothetical protein
MGCVVITRLNALWRTVEGVEALSPPGGPFNTLGEEFSEVRVFQIRIGFVFPGVA